MIGSTPFTSRPSRSLASIATSVRLCRSLERRVSSERGQEKGMFPLPLHPFPSKNRSQKCQGCARSKVSDMSPTVQHWRGGRRCLIEKTDYQADYHLLLPDGTIVSTAAQTKKSQTTEKEAP